MEKTKYRKHSVRAGLILALVWLMVAFLVTSVSAKTSESGKTTNNEFTWSWATVNTAKNAAGTFSASLTGTTLTLEISATSSTFVDNDCSDDINAGTTVNTATITNNTGSTISIATITATTATCSVSQGAMLANGDKFSISITANPQSYNDTTPRTSSGSVVITYEVVENINVVYYGADGASYTYGDVLLSDDSASVTTETPVGSAITLPAAPTVTSGTFKGWRTSHDGSLHEASTSITINADTSVYPVIVPDGTVAPFTVNDIAYEYWTDAALAAGNSGTIILNRDYTLPTTMAANGVSPVGSLFVTGTDGNVNYIVPKGVTLLIPYNTDHTLYKNNPELVIDNAAVVTPTAFRTLTMAEGTNITINGAMSLSGKVHAYMGGRYQNSAPTGPSGFVNMKSGSSITVDNGGTLYTWGYIIGNGEVIANNGGTVYECFQVRDWRGGDATSGMVNNGQRVFPVSQYYVQNIEVPLTLHYGAIEKGFLATYVQRMKKTAEFTFIGSDGMFRLGENSTVTKRYDGKTDRLIIDIDGNMTVSSLVISIDTGIIGSVTLNSANYTLPINSNFTVNILPESNVTISQDIALLPGAIINVEQGAKMTLGSGTKVFIYDKDQWGNYCVGGVQLRTVCWAYSRDYTRTAANMVDAQIVINGEVDASAGYVYTTSGGAGICSTGSGVIKLTQGSATKTHQATQADTDISYVEIPITTAQLKNGNGSYVQSGTNTYTYCSECLTWVEGADHAKDSGYIASNLELGNNLNFHFAFFNEHISADSGHYIMIGDERFDFAQWKANDTTGDGSVDYYIVTYTGLAAKQMKDTLTVTLYDASGNPIDTWSDSVYCYGIRIMEKYPDNMDLKALIIDMLHYGAACQNLFGYNTGNLANAGITGTGSTYTFDGVSTAVPGDATYFSGVNLVTTSNIQFAVMPTDAFTSDMKATYSFVDYWGDTVSGDLKLHADGYYYIDRLVVADAKQTITITVNGVDYVDSIENYCARMYASTSATAHQQAAFLAFMKFSTSAKAYLEGGNRVQ